MRSTTKLILVLLMGALSTNAQDVHFSQYFTSPMTLNPANTGLLNKNFRIATNYRVQWSSITSNPYETYTVSFDGTLFKDRWDNGDALGYGVMLLNDKAGAGQLTNSTLGFSLAYHHSFGKNKDQAISIGAQSYLVNKSIDIYNLVFGDQFDPVSGTASGTTNENFLNNKEGYSDFNTGIIYTGRVSETATMYTGASFYHLTRPNETFFNGPNRIHTRISGFLGGSFEITDYLVTYGSTLYQRQGSQSEFLVGGAAGFVLNPGHSFDSKDNVLYTGLWYRFNDAVIPYIGFEINEMTLGFTYDATVSALNAANNYQGAYEISFIYGGRYPKAEPRQKYNFACPKF